MTISVAHAGPGNGFTPEQTAAVMAELVAILASESFSSSKRCCDFIEFAVKRALAGDYESLTERFLGVELFGKAVDYETSTDSVVRVRANDVRRRLSQFYSSQRSPSPVRIELVAGRYIPEFHWQRGEPAEKAAEAGPAPDSHASAGALLAHETETAPSASGKTIWRTSAFRWGLALALVVTAATLVLTLRPRESNFDRFWKPVIDSPSLPVLDLPTTDTYQATELFSQAHPANSFKFGPNDLQALHNWHESLPILQATLSVAIALARKGKSPIVRVGTDLSPDEVHGHPIIAIGSFSNPWVEHDVAGLRFTFDRGSSNNEAPRIRDAFNSNRSWVLYQIFPAPQSKDYAIVTRTFDPVTHEVFVSLAGLHTFGNQIAGEFVSQDSSWDAVAAHAPSGWERMNLQVVLEADVVGITPGTPRILAVYCWR